MIEKLHDQCSPIPQYDIVKKINELIDQSNNTHGEQFRENVRLDLLVRFVNDGAMRREEMTGTDHELAMELQNEGSVTSDGAEMWISDAGRKTLMRSGR